MRLNRMKRTVFSLVGVFCSHVGHVFANLWLMYTLSHCLGLALILGPETHASMAQTRVHGVLSLVRSRSSVCKSMYLNVHNSFDQASDVLSFVK